MKKAILVLLVCVAVFWGTLNKDKMSDSWSGVEKKLSAFLGNRGLEEDLEEEEEPEDATEEKPAPPPRKEPVVVEAEPAPAPQPTLLPEGQYYTRERIVETSDTGLAAIPAGRLVTKLGEKDGKYWIEDPEKGTRLHAEPWKLTQNPAEAPGVMPAVTEVPKAPLSRKEKAAAERAERATAARAKLAAREADLQAEVMATKLAAQKREIIRQQIKALDGHISAVQVELNSVKEKQRTASGANSHGITISRLTRQMDELKGQRGRLYEALAQIK